MEKKIKRATVYYSGLGSSELYLNGAKVGDAVLSPAVAQYDKRAFYVTYDVTKQLKRGAKPLVDAEENKEVVVALREIAAGYIKPNYPDGQQPE